MLTIVGPWIGLAASAGPLILSLLAVSVVTIVLLVVALFVATKK